MTTTEPSVVIDAEQRTQYIAGLRKLADLLDANPAMPMPWTGSEHSTLDVFVEQKDDVAAYARALGKATKKVNDADNYGFQLRGAIHGLHIRVYAPRDQVCTRRVIGTREVTEYVPDPDALAGVPVIELTHTVQDVEWDCHPILDGRAVQS